MKYTVVLNESREVIAAAPSARPSQVAPLAPPAREKRPEEGAGESVEPQADHEVFGPVPSAGQEVLEVELPATRETLEPEELLRTLTAAVSDGQAAE